MKKLGENEKAIFYDDIMCAKWDDGYSMVIAVQKESGQREYLLIKDSVPIYASASAEAVYYYHDAMGVIDRSEK